MDEISEAVEAAGYTIFLVAGIKVDEATNMPYMRCGCDANIVRRLSNDSWRIMRATLIREVDMLRNAPLDDLTRA